MAKEVAYKRGPYKQRTAPNKERAMTIKKLEDFDRFLIKVLATTAKTNAWIVPPGLVTIEMIRKIYGTRAEAIWDEWFFAKRHVNPFKLDRVDIRLEAGEINIKEADHLRLTWCYEPVWQVREEKRLEAHAKISKKLSS